MLKLTAVVSILLMGSALWAAGLSCDSCGSECAAACGTRHFRSCCFNYLRRKRAPLLGLQLTQPQLQDLPPKDGRLSPNRAPLVVVENVPADIPRYPDPWFNLLQATRPIEDRDDRVVFYDS